MSSDPLIASTINAAATVIGAGLGAVATWWGLRGKRLEAQQEAKRANTSLQKLETAIVDTGKSPDVVSGFGYSTKQQCHTWTISDDGSGTTIQEVIELRAHQTFQNLAIPFRSSGDGSREPPRARVLPPSVQRVRIDRVTRHSEQVLEGQVVIDGVIGPTSVPVSYILESSFHGLFAMTRSECETRFANSAWKTEYSSKVVSCPMETLKLIVRFPPLFHHHIEPPKPVVFLGRTETVHGGETDRIMASGADLEFDGKVVSLRISRPIIGLKYAITWLPPD
jgi:hypothetical protein